jgi:hypothetical protein
MLTRKVMDRLGCGEEGVEEIKSHPFNHCLDWDLVARKQYDPEFVPPDDGEWGTSNFDEKFTREVVPGASGGGSQIDECSSEGRAGRQDVAQEVVLHRR